jgi:hypothetical protein
MTTQSLTAEFAIEQLKILCQDGDVSDAFPDFEKSSDDDEDEGVSSQDISNFVGMLARSDWESQEEFFKFYEFVGYELFTTASDPEFNDEFDGYYTSPNDLKFSRYELYTSPGCGYFDLYAKAREFCPNFSPGLVEIPTECDVEAEDISIIDLIPATVAYTYDYGEYLSGHSCIFDELQIQFWCDVIYFLGAGYVDSSSHYDERWPKMDMALCMGNAVFLEYLFYCTEETNNDSYIYSRGCINHLCENQSTTSKILKTIALAATRNYEKLVSEFEEEEIWHGSEDSFEKFHESVMEDVTEDSLWYWNVEKILKTIKRHRNCTDEIVEIIAQYESENSDDGEEEDL